MPPKSKKVEGKSSPKSPKNKTKRCPKGEHRNPITGVCEKKRSEEPKQPKETEEPKQPKQPKEPKKSKESKEKQTKQKTEIREKPINFKKMNQKEIKIFDERKECIQKYRKKIPSLLEGSTESEE